MIYYLICDYDHYTVWLARPQEKACFQHKTGHNALRYEGSILGLLTWFNEEPGIGSPFSDN